MRTLNPVDFAEMAVSSGNGDEAIIVLDLVNSGSGSRWAQQFPCLENDTINMLDDGVTFLHFSSTREAIDKFERLTLDCAENGTGGLIGGTISLVMTPWGEDDGVESLSWDLHDDTRPVFVPQGRGAWRYETIAERI